MKKINGSNMLKSIISRRMIELSTDETGKGSVSKFCRQKRLNRKNTQKYINGNKSIDGEKLIELLEKCEINLYYTEGKETIY